jgi:serine/threonine protein kinase
MSGSDSASATTGTDEMVGKVINNYRIVGPLGEGGMGAVFLAEHPFMGRKAAVKVLRPEFAADQDVVERFMNEARAANAIHHPNIIDIIDVGRMPPTGIPYLMMEFLEGANLTERTTRAGTLSVDEALELGTQTAGALSAAHLKGIVHRDLKPDNIYVLDDPSNPIGVRVKILDFGIAKLRADVSRSEKRTMAGVKMGSPYYMSPEQWGGRPEEIDHRTDIYALGIVLYEMLTGTPPFKGSTQQEIMTAHITQPLPPLRAKNPLVPEGLEAVIVKAVAKKREDRYASMAEMQAAMRSSRVPPGIASVSPTIVVRGNQVPPAPMPLPPHRGQPTTFSGATGEIRPDLSFVPGEAPAGRKLWIPAVALLVLGVAGASGYAFLSKKNTAVEPPPPKPVAAQVHVQFNSSPSGAKVTDITRGGVQLGETPFNITFDRRDTPIDVVLAKEGYEPSKIKVDLDRDGTADATLHPLPTEKPNPGSETAPSSGKEPAQPKRVEHKSGHKPPGSVVPSAPKRSVVEDL